MLSAPVPSADTAERGAWAGLEGRWERLFGDFFGGGLSIEWHDFETPHALDWGRSFHGESIELCLNFSGSGTIGAEEIKAGSVNLYTRGEREIRASRRAGERHRFITVELSRPFLQGQLGDSLDDLRGGPRDFMLSNKRRDSVIVTREMEAGERTLLTTLRSPPVSEPARPIWYRGKVLELMSQLLFAPPPREFFCAKQKRLSRERTDRVKAILREKLESPPELAAIAKLVGCSAFYLSRVFSEEAGMTIPQFLRKVRMEKATALLLSGKFNVTETALEVGYSSLSHFSRAFCETTGYCPALYSAMMVARARKDGTR